MRADRERRAERGRSLGLSQSAIRGHARADEPSFSLFRSVEQGGRLSIKHLPDGKAAIWTADAKGRMHKKITTQAAADKLGTAVEGDPEVEVKDS